MAGRKSYLEASYGCAKKMKETGTLLVQSVTSEKKSVESPNPLITKEAHQYKKADLDPASGVALHTTEV
ncbi:unnamed protein product [Lupinus luteus]|uniref:Uncharacterized protein n=1 Tax=Lupinus luteus TaxID=3873 RepID=A0AAV1X070_LUPLU